MQFFVKDTLWN